MDSQDFARFLMIFVDFYGMLDFNRFSIDSIGFLGLY